MASEVWPFRSEDEKLNEGQKLNDSKDMQFGEAFVEGEQTRNSFQKGQAAHATELLETVNSDVYGPLQTTSLGGHYYFVTFIDDKSRFTAKYFVKNKDEVLQKFKDFEDMATNITGQRIKNLRSDNGGEYISKKFNDFSKVFQRREVSQEHQNRMGSQRE